MDHVLFPRFWVEEPALWFAQVEAVFALNNITSDADKYDYILCELPSTVISLIKDLILDTTFDEEKYERVKKELITRISITELEKEEIGEKRPSEFFEHLKKKADLRISEKVLKEIWLKKLPLQVNNIVNNMKGDIQSVCELADTIKEFIPLPSLSKPTGGGTSTGETSNLLENLRFQLENIHSELMKLKLVYSENNNHLEKVEAELKNFKLAYGKNNTILDIIQTELQKIKSGLCGQNNNDRSMCDICKENESIKNTENEETDNNNEKSVAKHE